MYEYVHKVPHQINNLLMKQGKSKLKNKDFINSDIGKLL